ncbi:trypsin-like peptidase domain-containing protein [Oscillatoria sp. CS-180]|uniref:S1C family serine protease n=1 Tax=Oscillatoria sp. CS-180 TaxID=3021720 RepID=UPI00232D9DB1|nr:trypsin-like peptidase domain-containing protein [Oscillatoria sp. CS-180]MDB9526139.1 trypsin-like peptidase domain-containing protein [Oscillatoria sp. CS-180]
MTTAIAALSNALSDIITQTSQAIVAVKGQRSAGTGIHWRKGLIVTSCEALRQGDHLRLGLPDGQTVETELLGSDASTDVAVLALPEGTDLPVVSLGNNQDLALGQLVTTVGRSVRRGLFASLGMVSQISGPWRSQSGGQLDQYIEVNLSLYQGSAGCPLINADGQVVGFNTFGPRRRILTIPATTVNQVVQQLQQRGKIARGYLGLGMQTVPLSEAVRQQHDLANQSAVIVVSVESGSAADQAGLLLGDVIVTINDETIESVQQIQTYLGPQSVGQALTVQVLRGGQPQTVTVTVGER